LAIQWLFERSLLAGGTTVAIDSLELQLASALQRYHMLQRRAETQKESPALVTRTLAELGTALEELRVAQDQMFDSRQRVHELQTQLTDQRTRYWELFDEMPQPYVVTRTNSIIVEVNRAGAELFNVSQRFLVGKAMSIFVCEDRSRFLTQLTQIGVQPDTSSLSFRLRPRERAPLSVEAKVKGDGSALRWLLSAPVRPSASSADAS
jgi:PAS domain S-box-containing protein